MPLTATALAERFAVDGAIVVRGAFGPDWLELLAAGIERNRREPSEFFSSYTAAGAPGGYWGDYCSWQRIPEYRSFVEGSGVAALAGEVLGADHVRFFHEHVLVKEPNTREPTPWHHDQPYYPVDGDLVCSIWLPLDPVPLDVCPEFALGSHRGPMYMPRYFVDGDGYGYEAGSYAPVPDDETLHREFPIAAWELAPGDCVVFHMRTLHGAPGTVGSAHRRRVFTTRWLGDDAVYARRPGRTSPPYPDLDLDVGGPMDHDLFPILWRRE